MALSRAKYRRLPDLYVAGKELVLKDGSSHVAAGAQPLPGRRGTARRAGARAAAWSWLSRSTAAPRWPSSRPRCGRTAKRAPAPAVVESSATRRRQQIVDDIRNDTGLERAPGHHGPRTPMTTATLEDSEQALLDRDPARPTSTTSRRRWTARATTSPASTRTLPARTCCARSTPSSTSTAVVRSWRRRVPHRRALVRRPGLRRHAGRRRPWDHAPARAISSQVFESKAEMRQLPDDLSDLLSDGLDELAMSLRDAKDLDRLASSSDSSRQPSEPEESTPSTPNETPSSALVPRRSHLSRPQRPELVGDDTTRTARRSHIWLNDEAIGEHFATGSRRATPSRAQPPTSSCRWTERTDRDLKRG